VVGPASNPIRRLRFTIEYLEGRPRLGATVAGWLFGEWFGEHGYSRQQTAALVRGRMSRTPPLALVARAGGEAVGTVSLVPDAHPLRPGTVHCLAGLYVAPPWRGRGVGARLCRRAVREAGRLGIATLHLYTADAERFFQKLGWHKVVDAVIEGSRGLELAAFLGIDTGSAAVHAQST
jgi:predicted N-acetyltransferase YhbS